MNCPNCGTKIALKKSLSVAKQGPVECKECEEEFDPQKNPNRLLK